MQKTSKLLITSILISSFLILSGCSSENYCSQENVQNVLSQSQKARASICAARLANNDDIAFLQKNGAGYLVDGDKIYIAVPTDKLFLVNSAEFKRGSSHLLDATVTIAKQYPEMAINVIGNTDPIASENFNQQLSTNQAVQVAGYLWSHGVPNSSYQKISYKGHGELKPIATNETLSGMAKNRNIMIVIRPKKQKKVLAPPKRTKSKYTKTYKKTYSKD